MTIYHMAEYLMNRGFKVERRYNTAAKLYEFTIIKDGIAIMDRFVYPAYTKDGAGIDRIQRDFLENLMSAHAHKKAEIEEFCGRDVEMTAAIHERVTVMRVMEIKDVIFNNPATIVFWMDGTKTVVKCQDGDIYDPEKGLAMAISKKALGNQGNYCNELKKWLGKYVDPAEYPCSIRQAFENAAAQITDVAECLRKLTGSKED